MQFNNKREGWSVDNQAWLGSAHGTENAQTVTIDGSFIAEFDGIIPSGTPLTEVGDGKYAPVTSSADFLAGFLLTPQSVEGDNDVIAPMIWHGRIKADNLPASAFDVTTLTDRNPQLNIEPRPASAPDTEGEV